MPRRRDKFDRKLFHCKILGVSTGAVQQGVSFFETLKKLLRIGMPSQKQI